MKKKKSQSWTTVAQECVRKYNETEHTVTGFAPIYLLEGTNVSILPDELRNTDTQDEWVKNRKIALERTKRSHNYNKALYDKNRVDYDFNIGDMVFVENGNKLNRKKLDELKVGPYEIMERLSKSIFRIDTGHKKSESNLFHVSKLIPNPENQSNVVAFSPGGGGM